MLTRILTCVNIDIVEDTQMGFDYKQVRKHLGAILRYRCKFESYRTCQLCIKEF